MWQRDYTVWIFKQESFLEMTNKCSLHVIILFEGWCACSSASGPDGDVHTSSPPTIVSFLFVHFSCFQKLTKVRFTLQFCWKVQRRDRGRFPSTVPPRLYSDILQILDFVFNETGKGKFLCFWKYDKTTKCYLINAENVGQSTIEKYGSWKFSNANKMAKTCWRKLEKVPLKVLVIEYLLHIICKKFLIRYLLSTLPHNDTWTIDMELDWQHVVSILETWNFFNYWIIFKASQNEDIHTRNMPHR